MMRPWEYSAFAVTVADARAIAPGWRRLTLAAPELRDFAPWGLDQRIKLVLPLPDGGLADFGLMAEPTPHPSEWYARWKALPETERNVLRTYTPSAIRPEQGEIDVDVLLHDPPGPASAWAAGATPGERLWITGPDRRNGWTGYGLHWQAPAGATRWLLVGDETAFPAIANILRTLPEGGRAEVLLEAGDARDDIVSPEAPAGARVRLVARAAVAGEALEAAVRELPVADAEYVWLAGEAGAVTRIRRHLTAERGVSKDRVSFLGYWKLGGPLVG
ncbi:siderophore-interacting protein [Microbacterium neimengense]